MPEKSPPQRFIAGAACPSCGLLDKIVIEPEADRRRCVNCGFSEDRPGEPELPPVEPVTRVTRAAARRVETPAEPVTMVVPTDRNQGNND